MKDMLKLYAKYNQDTNNTIIKLLSGFSEEELAEERNIYFESISLLFAHLVGAGWGYQIGISIITEGKYFPGIRECGISRDRIRSSFKEASTIMQELDKNFVEFAEKVTEEDLKIRMENFETYDERLINVSVWEILTQHITHQIHHRGQLSQVLDELKVEHDIGNVWPYFEEVQ